MLKKNNNTTAKVTLSQCMIVKNEERNIEKALSWGKNIVCEQIVVDTGSTDRTKELAEQMGAKVLDFEWRDDFAAAKNFAIEQATGDWIAFLDADEYISETDVPSIVPLLEQIFSDPSRRERCLVLSSPLINLDDKGKPKKIQEQMRIFRNLSAVRYTGSIHEQLAVSDKNIEKTKRFRVMHTGYAGEQMLAAGKASRNVRMLRNRLAEAPKDPNLKAYLANALLGEKAALEAAAASSAGEEKEEKLAKAEEMRAEADKLFVEALNARRKLADGLKLATYEYFFKDYYYAARPDPELDRLCEQAHKEFPDEHKLACYYAMSLSKNGDYGKAYNILKQCEKDLDATMGGGSALTTEVMELLAALMIPAAQATGDMEAVMKYAEVLLIMDKTNTGILCPYIANLSQQHSSNDDILGILARVYDLSSKKDLLLIARAAKDCGAIGLARRIIDVAAYLGDD